MPTFLLSDQSCDTRWTLRDMDIPEGCLLDRCGVEPRMLHAHVPYVLAGDDGADPYGIGSLLEPHGPRLTDLCLSIGGPATLGLAALTDDLRQAVDDGLGHFGAAAGVYSARANRFRQAVDSYEQAMLGYYHATRKGAPSHLSRSAALAQLQSSSAELHRRFQLELDVAARRLTPRYRTLLSGGKRVPDLVRQTRKVARLDVASRIEGSLLERLARAVTKAGQGLMVVDVARRAKRVYEEFERGADWRREAFVQTGGFTAATVMGQLLGRAGGGALGFVFISTRSGWAVVAVAAPTVKFVADGTQAADRLGQLGAGSLYDEVVGILERTR